MKEEYHAVWERIANIGEDSPAAFIMKKVVDEMKTTIGRNRKFIIELDGSHIYNALNYAQDK